MFIHYLAIFRYRIYHYYYYINIPLLANKSDLLRTPLVVSGVLLLLLLSVEERLQELQPLLNVGRHRRHGGLQELQPLLQLPVCWRGPDIVKWCLQCSVLVISLFYFSPRRMLLMWGLTTHSDWAPRCFCLSWEGWLDRRKSLLHTITDQAKAQLSGQCGMFLSEESTPGPCLLCWQDRYSGKNTNNFSSLKI